MAQQSEDRDPADPADVVDIYTKASQDTSFEIALDDHDESPVARPAVPVDQAECPAGREPVVPVSLRSVVGVRAATLRTLDSVGYHTRRQAWYTMTRYSWQVPGYAVAGVFKGAWKAVWWMWNADGAHHLTQQLAQADDSKAWAQVEGRLTAKRRWRAGVLATCLFLLVVAALLLALAAPWWVAYLVGVCLLPPLAWVGHPADKPILQRAMVTSRYRKLSADIVLRAYYAAKLGRPDREDQRIEFASTMSRDRSGMGSQVAVLMPYGAPFTDVMNAREKLASGLDVSIQQVYLTRAHHSEREHVLYVADRDPLAIPAGRTPLLRCKPTDIWAPAPLGLDERGRKVTVPLLWNSILVGAQPRKGKTFSARALALYAALDPYVRLIIVDGKASPDWRMFALVADAYIAGTMPTRGGDPVEQFKVTLRAVKKDIQARNERLSTLPTDICPEGKLTRDIARNPKMNIPVTLLLIDEFQAYYELDEKADSAEIASLLSFIISVGPSVGIVVVSSTQKPSGIGAGADVARLFTRYRDNHAVRFALKTGNRNVSEAVLGSEAYGEGIDASSLPVGDGTDGQPDYRGIGYLYGLTDKTPCVRTYFADAADAEHICKAARALRERAGTLAGMAAGASIDATDPTDVLRDARQAFTAGQVSLSWHELADRLRTTYPSRYADITADTVSAQLRAFGVDSASVADKTHFASGRGRGCKVTDLDSAIERKTKDR
jgi:hypothetical protein